MLPESSVRRCVERTDRAFAVFAMRAGRRLRRGAASACLASMAATQGACSILLDTTPEQCSADVDCANRRGAFANAACVNHVCVARPVDEMVDASSDPVWGCLGHVVMGAPQSATVRVAIPFWDLIRMMPITDVAMRACPKLDVPCSRPIQPAAPAGEDGVVSLNVPALFDGYGQVLSLNADDGGDTDTTDAGDARDGGGNGGDSGDRREGGAPKWIPSLVFFNPPLVNDSTYNRVPLFLPDDIRLLAAVQNNTWDLGHGLAFVGALDCSGNPAAGVAWEPSIVDTSSKRFYYINSFPDEAAVATDSSGLGGVLNAPTGTLTITARVQATGQRIGTATMFVRAGVASYTYLSPTP